jgi:hypothetical protein
MASYPPRTCCFQGVKHEGDPTGEFITIDDFEAYMKIPDGEPAKNGIILYVVTYRGLNKSLD